MIRTGLALLAVVVTLGRPSEAAAQLNKSDAQVTVTATADKPDEKGKQTVTITIETKKPYHIYANPVGQADLASVATVVEITGKTKPQSVKIDYPKGKVEKDETVGDYMIYEGKVSIKAEVFRAKGDTGPLKASVALQACSKTGCLLPATVVVEVK